MDTQARTLTNAQNFKMFRPSARASNSWKTRLGVVFSHTDWPEYRRGSDEFEMFYLGAIVTYQGISKTDRGKLSN